MSKLPKCKFDPNLLIGFDSADDAAVYKVSDDIGVIQTVDFFPPMVDDPYTFGKIAATNALSDVYAMGGEVKTAMNIVCFPQSWDINMLGEILRGGSEKVIEAGGVLVGGHSINDVDAADPPGGPPVVPEAAAHPPLPTMQPGLHRSRVWKRL